MDLFRMYPKQGWKILLDYLEDPDDIENVFYAFPELIPLLFKQYELTCLFAILIPKYLSFNDVLNCRLVSPEWKTAVDRALATHPDRKPYQNIVSSRVTLRGPFNYQMLNEITTSSEFILSEDVDEIMQLPSTTNPFVGRSLTIEDALDFHDSRDADPLTRLLPIVTKFGQHVYYLNIKIFWTASEDWASLFKWALQECLPHLPNLKSFKLEGNTEFVLDNRTEFMEWLKDIWGSPDTASSIQIPAQLETLDFSSLGEMRSEVLHKLFTALVKHNRLQKLALLPENWDASLMSLCQHLRELELHFSMSDLYEKDVLEELHGMLLQLPNPSNLLKLSIFARSISFSALLHVLSHFAIQSIQVDVQLPLHEDRNRHLYTAEGGYRKAPLGISVPSIRRLILDESIGFTIQHLETLPNLEYFEVRGSNCRDGFVANLIDPEAPAPMVGNSLWAYFDGLKRHGTEEKSVWDVIPNLKMFTVSSLQGEVRRWFVRECENKVFMC